MVYTNCGIKMVDFSKNTTIKTENLMVYQKCISWMDNYVKLIMRMKMKKMKYG